MAYDEDQYAGNRAMCIHVPVPAPANDAAGVIATLQMFTRIKLLEARAVVVGESYDDGTTTIDVYVDDGSIGACVMSTATKGQIIDASLADTVVASTSSICLHMSHATATGACDVILQYQELFE